MTLKKELTPDEIHPFANDPEALAIYEERVAALQAGILRAYREAYTPVDESIKADIQALSSRDSVLPTRKAIKYDLANTLKTKVAAKWRLEYLAAEISPEERKETQDMVGHILQASAALIARYKLPTVADNNNFASRTIFSHSLFLASHTGLVLSHENSSSDGRLELDFRRLPELRHGDPFSDPSYASRIEDFIYNFTQDLGFDQRKIRGLTINHSSKPFRARVDNGSDYSNVFTGYNTGCRLLIMHQNYLTRHAQLIGFPYE